MDYIYETVKDICVFIILTTTINNLLSGSVYRRYIKAVTGLMVTLIIIHPVMELLDVGESYINTFESYSSRLDMAELKRDIRMNSDIYGKISPDYYTDVLNRSLEDYISSKGYTYINSEWDIDLDGSSSDYGCIKGLKVDVGKKDIGGAGDIIIDDKGQVSVKSDVLEEELSEYYGIDRKNVRAVIK